MMKHQLSSLCLLLTLIGITLAPANAEPANSASSSHAPGLVQESDGYMHFYNKDGSPVRGQFVKVDADTIYYFSMNGRGIKQRVTVINKHLIQLWNSGTTSVFLIIGDKEALMIDGMFGMGDLRQLASFYTDKPIKIALTHGGVDHSGAAYRYEAFKQVYLNPLDDPMFLHFGQSPERRFTNDVNEANGVSKSGDLYKVLAVEDYSVPSPETKLVPMNDGTQFDLGGLTVEAIWATGHTLGCTSFLLKEPRILITGDCVMVGSRPNQTTVEVFRQTVLKFIVRKGEWDTIYTSHGTSDTRAPLDMFDNILEICDLVLSGRVRGLVIPPNSDNIFGDQSGKLTTRGAGGTDGLKPFYMNYDSKKILNAQE